MKLRKSISVQRGSIRLWDALAIGTIAGGLALGVYAIRSDRAARTVQNCTEWRQDLYETRELCQLDHPKYSCLDRDPASGKWLGTTYAKNICSTAGANSGSGGGHSSSYINPNAPDGQQPTRSISRGGFGGAHGSGGG